MLGGMGMGGGTVLIPALTVILGVEQHVAQATNLIAFLPMALFTLKIHKAFAFGGAEKALRRLSRRAVGQAVNTGGRQFFEISFLNGRIVNISRQYKNAAVNARQAGAQITICHTSET